MKSTGATLPLSGIKVLDLSSLLPGPLATLFLSEAGAQVLKVERPGVGDPGRVSRLGRQGENVEFALINRGKSSIAVDMKTAEGRAEIARLAAQADVLVEQFRPGVMARLGLDYATLSAHNPRLIYCSLTGYGQTGPLAQRAGHDLNYIARSGMLAISVDAQGQPVLPQGHFADVGGGSFPVVVNILMALLQRHQTGRGCHLDVAMCENTFAWMRRGLAPLFAGGTPPAAGSYPHAGGTPRYAIYRTADGRYLAVAPLEEQFWSRFCDLIGLAPEERDDRKDPEAVRQRVATLLAARSAEAWMALFDGEDVCVDVVRELPEAVADSHFAERGVFQAEIALKDGSRIRALPLPIHPAFRRGELAGYPALGANPQGFSEGV